MPSIQRMTTSYQKDQQKYCKIAEFRNRLTGISMLISVLEGLLGVSSSTIFKGKGYIQLKTEDDIDKVYEPGVYAIKGTSYNDQTLLVFSHNLGQSTVQFRTNNYGGFLVFRIKWWNGGWGTWKTVSLT